MKYEVGHIQLFDKGKVNNLSPQVSTVGSSFIRQAVAYAGRRRNRSERGLGIRNEQNEWGGNVHVRGWGVEFSWSVCLSVCPLGLYLLPGAWT